MSNRKILYLSKNQQYSWKKGLILPSLIHDRQISYLGDRIKSGFNSVFNTLLSDPLSMRKGDKIMSFDTKEKELIFYNLKG